MNLDLEYVALIWIMGGFAVAVAMGVTINGIRRRDLPPPPTDWKSRNDRIYADLRRATDKFEYRPGETL